MATCVARQRLALFDHPFHRWPQRWATVLEEQKSQKERGIHDEEALAQAARAESHRHVMKAAALGKLDQESVDSYLNRRSFDTQVPKPGGPKGDERRPWFRRRRSLQEGRGYGKVQKHVMGGSMRRLLGMKK